jgi:hypothetical protein
MVPNNIKEQDIPNLHEWKAASRILKKAVQLINQNGWQQGEVLPSSRECLATSIERAYESDQHTIVDFNYAREALSRVLQVDRDPKAISDDILDVP